MEPLQCRGSSAPGRRTEPALRPVLPTLFGPPDALGLQPLCGAPNPLGWPRDGSFPETTGPRRADAGFRGRALRLQPISHELCCLLQRMGLRLVSVASLVFRSPFPRSITMDRAISCGGTHGDERARGRRLLRGHGLLRLWICSLPPATKGPRNAEALDDSRRHLAWALGLVGLALSGVSLPCLVVEVRGQHAVPLPPLGVFHSRLGDLLVPRSYPAGSGRLVGAPAPGDCLGRFARGALGDGHDVPVAFLDPARRYLRFRERPLWAGPRVDRPDHLGRLGRGRFDER